MQHSVDAGRLQPTSRICLRITGSFSSAPHPPQHSHGVLSAHDGSSSSNLTSRNVSLLTALQLDTLKVAPGDVVVHVPLSQKSGPTRLVFVTGLSQPVRDTRVWDGMCWNHYR